METGSAGEMETKEFFVFPFRRDSLFLFSIPKDLLLVSAFARVIPFPAAPLY
jgi:hypothetical protein